VLKRLRDSPTLRRILPLILLTVGADVGLALPATRYGAAFALLWLLPGLAWAGLLVGPRRRAAGRRSLVLEIAVGLGLGMGTIILLTLLLHYLPGPLSLPVLLMAVNLFNLVMAVLARRSTLADGRVFPRRPARVDLSLIVLVAGLLRLVHLGYSELQGDEGIVMMRAARAILGDDAQLFYHQKGPVEVLLPVATWTLSGSIGEWQARLPFAFAGLVGIVALYLLGRHWFNRRSALIAALLLAINGYFVGFGRIVQYQSVVLAMTTLGLLALWRWSEGGRWRWLIAGGALLAFGLLAHYDAALALPAGVYIVGRRLWDSRARWRALAAEVIGAVALAAGILALFYVPFALHPNFAKTMSYLGGARIGTAGPLYNNLLSSLPLATFYNSTYYLISLAGLIVVASFLPFLYEGKRSGSFPYEGKRSGSFRRLGLLIPAACYLLLLLMQCAVLAPTVQCSEPFTTKVVPSLSLGVGPVAAILLIALLLSRYSSTSSRAAWLWFGAPFLFYYFLVWDPRTHVLNAFPGAVLLAAHALDRLVSSVQPPASSLSRGDHPPPRLRGGQRGGHHGALLLWIGLLAIFVFLAYYPYLMFVQHDPEIKRTWPAHQPALYWKPDDETPLFGYFGFPYRAGWKVVGALIEEGVLSGVYASNEEQEVTGWYTRGAERTYCPDPEWYLIAENVQDEVPLRQADVEATHHLWGEVQVSGKVRLRIYHQDRWDPPTSPAIFAGEDFEAYGSHFDARTTPANVVPSPPTEYVPAGYTLGEAVKLLGYRLDTADVRPGGSIDLILYWEGLQPLEASYQVFNHLYDGTMWGQQDGTPGCALRPTTLWEPGHVVRDEYTIPIDPATPPDDVPLLVGMYRLDTEERLPVCDPNGTPIGDAIPLVVVTVR
jgi:hypothetical protein